MNQTCHFVYEAHTQLCCSSIMQSKWGEGELCQRLLLFTEEKGGWCCRGAESAYTILERALMGCQKIVTS